MVLEYPCREKGRVGGEKRRVEGERGTDGGQKRSKGSEKKGEGSENNKEEKRLLLPPKRVTTIHLQSISSEGVNNLCPLFVLGRKTLLC